ncbi:putative uncharacterized protein [Moritella viscosa]|nr:putative uncharacterized protein [Moritella viscosa]
MIVTFHITSFTRMNGKQWRVLLIDITGLMIPRIKKLPYINNIFFIIIFFKCNILKSKTILNFYVQI